MLAIYISIFLIKKKSLVQMFGVSLQASESVEIWCGPYIHYRTCLAYVFFFFFFL